MPAPGFSIVIGSDPELIYYQALIRFKTDQRKYKIDGCVAKRFLISYAWRANKALRSS
jgi:hypothetical protein